ncbi:ABC transporter family substrate-binding protein [Herbiconiux sp. P15]|uniref:ABC transporter family substrate-binding protein n=1 Tax=Herbiconiux liukaitaii TaxID=3342799 RepID=UPI0035BA9412
MKRRSRLGVAVAVVGVSALALTACTTTTDDTTTESSGTITVATTNEATSFNSSTPQGNLDTNGMIQYLTGTSGTSAGASLGGFFTLDEEFNVVHNDNIGTYEKVSDDPLTVEYTLNDNLKWSDGEPITTDDLLVGWAIGSGYYDDATIDEATGEVTGGTQYFTLAGSTAGLDTTSFPEVSDDKLSLTLTYAEPFVDWELGNLLDKPAHVLAEKAGVSLEEFMQTLEDTPAGDPAAPVAPNETIKAAADFWNTGYDFTSFPEDESLLVASGPFIVTAYTPQQSISFGKNPEYTGSDEPAYDELVLRFIGDSNAQVTALQNGEVNAIFPQASADTLTALQNANLETLEGNQLSYDHLDLNFASGVFQDPTVREAFLKTIPRDQILSSIVTPVNPDAEVLNSQIFIPAEPEYTDAVAASGYDAYDTPDIEGAKALLAGATPTVRILYNTDNPNRVDSFQAIQSSAAEAGFNVVDAGSPDWSSLLPGGDYDASIFGWISPGAGNAALAQIFKTGGGGNYNNYSNTTVDGMVDEAQTELDEDALGQLKVQIDAETAKDFYGLPLFQAPGLFASNGTIDGLQFFGNQTGIVWNAQDWTLVE